MDKRGLILDAFKAKLHDVIVKLKNLVETTTGAAKEVENIFY